MVALLNRPIFESFGQMALEWELWLIPSNSNLIAKLKLDENKAENNYTNFTWHACEQKREKWKKKRDVIRSIYNKVHSSKSLCALKLKVENRKRNQKLWNKVFKLRLQYILSLSLRACVWLFDWLIASSVAFTMRECKIDAPHSGMQSVFKYKY